MADTERPLSAAELEEIERRRQEGKPLLDEEIAAKYDPDRLGRIVVHGAGRGEQLDATTRSEMEQRLPGADFSKVRVFRGPLAEEVAERHRADAVTISNTGMILMRDNMRSARGTTTGQALLAHELTHVVQAQKGMHFAGANGESRGRAEVERPAEKVEADTASGKSAKSKDAGESPEQIEAKRKKVIERVFELLEQDMILNRQRVGIF